MTERSPNSTLARRAIVRALTPAVALLVLACGSAGAQSLSYTKGQNVSPAYEGWEEGPDGELYFLFGYMNRNWDEEPDVPVGPDNFFAPGPEDRGQPTHFQPRRNRFMFRVPVPADFDESDELVWTLTVNGVTEKAYASLRPDYFVDNVVIMSETGALGAGTSSPEIRANQNPVIELEVPGVIQARVHEPVRLVARVTDDGVPRSRGGGRDDDEGDGDRRTAAAAGAGNAAGAGGAAAAGDGGDRRAEGGAAAGSATEPEEELTPEQRALRAVMNPPRRVTVGKRNGLHFAWFVYRGPKAVTFDPIQIQTWENTRAGGNSPWAFNWSAPPAPEDDRWVVNATFHQPGTYLLRGRADDGGLFADTEVTVHVRE